MQDKVSGSVLLVADGCPVSRQDILNAVRSSSKAKWVHTQWCFYFSADFLRINFNAGVYIMKNTMVVLEKDKQLSRKLHQKTHWKRIFLVIESSPRQPRLEKNNLKGRWGGGKNYPVLNHDKVRLLLRNKFMALYNHF